MESELLDGIEDVKNDAFYRMIQQQFQGTNKHLELITHLSERDIRFFSRLNVVQKWSKNNMSFADSFTKKFISMRVSLNRMGRKELFDTFKSQEQKEEIQQSAWKKWFTPKG